MARSGLWFGILLILGVVAGCETRVSLGTRCESDAQCSDALRCRFGRCRAECTTASDCLDPRAFCVGPLGMGVCTLPSEDRCTSACGDGLVCAGEICSTPCTPAGGECLAGSTCDDVAGVPVCVALPRVDAGVADAGLDDATSLDAPRREDASLDAGPITAPEHHGLCVGEAHACSLATDGRVFCWGASDGGRLGDGRDDFTAQAGDACDGSCSTRPLRPVRTATGELNDVIELACGAQHTCAITREGLAYCWGRVGDGVLGNTGRGGYVAGLVRDVAGATRIVAGRLHTCAQTSSGARCWGHNARAGVIDNRLGADARAPAQDLEELPIASPRFDAAIDLAGGGYFTCAAPPDASGVLCFGTNEAGAIGPETTWSSVNPPARPEGVVIAGTEGATQLGAGVLHACALVAGRARCWGGGAAGQLASSESDPCVDAISSPCRGEAREVDDALARTLVSLSTGYGLTQCAVVADGSVVCWGATDRGQAGHDGADHSVHALESAVPGLAIVASEVASANETSCARSADGRVFCWGSNDAGQLGCGLAPDAVAHPSACEVLFPSP
jgi:alpha-tubulin suppressor-like RCC1 family protein